MSLEDEPTARPDPSEPSGDAGADPPPGADHLDLPGAVPPRNVTSRADKRRNQRRR